MSSNQKLTLVTICDNTFALLLATLLKSIEVNLLEPTQFDLYLVDDAIRSSTKNKLLEAINPAVFCVHWVTIDEALPPDIALPMDRSTFPRNVFVRLFIPYFIPQHLTKVVYLDVDMIAHQDITSLWSIDLGNNLLGAIIDRAERVSSPWSGYGNYQALGLEADTKIFNSGLLLINPILWRQQQITRRVVRCIEQNAKYAVFPDQYGLNVVLANQWLELDRRWNCFAQSEEVNPYLIHFTGTKPIYTSYQFNKAYQEEFYHYLRMTPWHHYRPVAGWRRLLLKQTHKMAKWCYRLVYRVTALKGFFDGGPTDKRYQQRQSTSSVYGQEEQKYA
ncbi:glycosyltransferase family 8 protein [Spirosoma endophyticum]|uniref:Lipopolysaccharide biosynthesis protein, LPS:glycosyltransferase n=1 Tax=Spirosoma endophyticum TaxID=662367 RepID=A0A1I1WAE4_9BACT|nr:glycosyltransferase family 8 protein [Spirosoma endophyticum]SFD92082.1 Lipopolysaccharide biosynthesis protein, LPS:glycosyltransferase [Spirosoma endophyticum]